MWRQRKDLEVARSAVIMAVRYDRRSQAQYLGICGNESQQTVETDARAVTELHGLRCVLVIQRTMLPEHHQSTRIQTRSATQMSHARHCECAQCVDVVDVLNLTNRLGKSGNFSTFYGPPQPKLSTTPMHIAETTIPTVKAATSNFLYSHSAVVIICQQ